MQDALKKFCESHYGTCGQDDCTTCGGNTRFMDELKSSFPDPKMLYYELSHLTRDDLERFENEDPSLFKPGPTKNKVALDLMVNYATRGFGDSVTDNRNNLADIWCLTCRLAEDEDFDDEDLDDEL